MPIKQPCGRCGAELAAFSINGICPACLLERGLSSTDGPAIATAEAPGAYIGPYKLLKQIGAGGMGIVWMAEQTESVRRRVALKVIKVGMDTRQVIARFKAERQALALMNHPNIAKVLDAGATATGRPYFVMELVEGVRITDYCDRNHLSTPDRLSLFIQVCQAIQHAHQKGIIHRDIKPSNILVILQDGLPVPRVIDFGIAKATEQPLTEQTICTAFGQFMGTPAYMSPEQVELSGLDMDTRSDIYALGVLLYELLTGGTPFDAAELWRAGLDEMRRRIREEDPARPSTRLGMMADAELTAIAQQRQSEPFKLTRLMRGDLDWIVMKCLEKDRVRRYETANGLAMDVQRHLENEPVLAGPPSKLYRFQKMLCRNWFIFSAGAVVATALVMGLGTATWSFLNERHALRRAHAAEARSQVRETQARAAEAKAREALSVFVEGQIVRKFPPRTNAFKANDPAASAFSADRHLAVPVTNLAPSASTSSNNSDPPVRMVRTAAHFDLYAGGGRNPSGSSPVVPASSVSYPQWAAAWWRWGMELPWTNSAGAVHPFIDTPNFDVTEGQQGEVWFLAAPFDHVTRSCTIPPGRFLFFPVLNVESSSLDVPPFLALSAEDQASIASYFADHALELFCEIDGIPVPDLAAYRFASPQVNFISPTPWIYGDIGGPGTSTGDGYYLMLWPLDPGPHTIRFGGAFHFRTPSDPFDLYVPLDMTYNLFIP